MEPERIPAVKSNANFSAGMVSRVRIAKNNLKFI